MNARPLEVSLTGRSPPYLLSIFLLSEYGIDETGCLDNLADILGICSLNARHHVYFLFSHLKDFDDVQFSHLPVNLFGFSHEYLQILLFERIPRLAKYLNFTLFHKNEIQVSIFKKIKPL